MSFSSRIKEELGRRLGPRHCRIAEIAALMELCGRVDRDASGRISITLNTENVAVARKCFTLFKKTFNIVADIRTSRNTYLKKAHNCRITIQGDADARKVLGAVKVEFPDGGAMLKAQGPGMANTVDDEVATGVGGTLKAQGTGMANTVGDEVETGVGGTLKAPFIPASVTARACCKRAFLRGAFLAVGSMSDPEKFYHLEFACPTQESALQLQGIISGFGPDAKIVPRKKSFVVYLKEGNQIVELLNVMDAGLGLMAFENTRIMKDMRNTINRQVNCETANINKTVSTGLRQADEIRLIMNNIGLASLPPSLREIAQLRLQNPDMALKELGESLDPPVGKSGVNHRLRKLSQIALELQGGGQEIVSRT
ncbi:MAG: DNA-binding protein WhiA [Lachnospiraceae bacterium]|jgi:DNA-binding transcriptional regulator WhiA|nr:DNA-binding protein WhiA [Lachnospiraceae bacterium]